MIEILQGNALEVLPQVQNVQCCVTSPPYWGLRDYGTPPQHWPTVEYSPMPGLPSLTIDPWDGELGQESTLEAFIGHLVLVFRKVRDSLRDDGTVWVNLGDSYASAWGVNRRNLISNGSMPDGSRGFRPNRCVNGLKEKDLCGAPWRMAFALQADGWFLRQDIIWEKPNPLPEPSSDRCTKSHEYLFLLTKQHKGYQFNWESIQEPAVSAGRVVLDVSHQPVADHRRKRSVWRCPVSAYKGAHYATFPPNLVEPCILAGSSPGDLVLDPFGGSGTVGLVAERLGRNSVLIELNPESVALAEDRTKVVQPVLI